MLISREWQSAKNLLPLVTRHCRSPILLYVLLGLDLALVGLHGIHLGTQYLPGQLFDLSQDRGYPELCQWGQIWVTAMLLWGLSFRRQSALYGSWALVFLLLLVNDMTLIHEQGGEWLAQSLSLPSALGLQSADYGELIVYGVAGLVVVGLVWYGSRHNRDVIAQPTTVWLFASVVSLLLVSEVFDFLRMVLEALTHTAFSPFWTECFVVLEEGSELAISSLSLWFVWRLWRTFANLPKGVSPKP
jgi:hypothetical protein